MLREVVRMLKSQGRRVSVTAPTGIAALAIGGSTIHSWAQVGLGQGSVHELYNKHMTRCGKRAKFNHDNDPNRIWNTNVLIVDEISMVRECAPSTLLSRSIWRTAHEEETQWFLDRNAGNVLI